MITTIRASKRIALGGFLGTGLLFICLLAVKDMNDKLGVMTASNAGYQKMTDSQADKIKSLTNEIESLRASKVSELRSAQNVKDKLLSQNEEMTRKFNALTKQNQNCNVKLDQVNDENKHLEAERDDLKRLSGRQKTDAEQVAIQLRDQIARLSMERDSCQRQYDALYKLHQEAADNLANLSNEKQRLQLQLQDTASSTKSSKQLQIPGGAAGSGGNGNNLRQQSSSIQPVGLEEPHINHQLSTSKGGSPANIAPVGAQPPVIGGNPEVVPMHQVRKEDVMEAPKVIQHFENLDAQHDHPGLQAPVYHDTDGDAFDDDDLEDNGLAPQDDYDNNKIIVNRKYDQDHVDHANSDLDYDFHSDFQPRQRQPAQPLPLRQKAVYHPQHQAPIQVIHDQHGGPRYLAPQVHQQHPLHQQQHQVPAQFQYRRGL